jgi:hypothetical protein
MPMTNINLAIVASRVPKHLNARNVLVPQTISISFARFSYFVSRTFSSSTSSCARVSSNKRTANKAKFDKIAQSAPRKKNPGSGQAAANAHWSKLLPSVVC